MKRTTVASPAAHNGAVKPDAPGPARAHSSASDAAASTQASENALGPSAKAPRNEGLSLCRSNAVPIWRAFSSDVWVEVAPSHDSTGGLDDRSNAPLLPRNPGLAMRRLNTPPVWRGLSETAGSDAVRASNTSTSRTSGGSEHASSLPSDGIARSHQLFDRSRAEWVTAKLLSSAVYGHDAIGLPGYLVPLDQESPTVRLSNVFARGGFSEVRFGLDATGRESVWRSVPIAVEQAPGQPKAVQTTPVEQLMTELMCLADVNSPLLPLRTLTDQDNVFHAEIPVFAADLFDLMPAFVPTRSGMYIAPAVAEVAVAAAIKVGKDVAAQLVVLHAKHWIHRDIKPENILYHPSRGAVLADYGLVGSSFEGGGKVAGTAGTVLYMAPEVLEENGNEAESYATSDLFSLGLSLAEIATGGRIDQLAIFRGTALERVSALHELVDEVGAPLRASLRSLDTPAKAYSFLAQGNRAFADLLFGTLLRPFHTERGTAADLLSALQQMQPVGSEGEAKGESLLMEAANAHQAAASARRQIASNFAALRQKPAYPPTSTPSAEEAA